MIDWSNGVIHEKAFGMVPVNMPANEDGDGFYEVQRYNIG
jgi:hypothetical protein